MFWLQHFSHKIEEWQKGVLIVMWTCWCTKHTLRGAFPGLSLPQPWLEDLTNAGGGELYNCNMAFWLYYGTPCAVFLPFMFWLQHFSYEIEEWQKGVLIVMWTCWCTKHTLCGAFPGLCLPQHLWEDVTSAEGGELIVIWLSGCAMVHPAQCFPFMFRLQHFSYELQ